MKPKPLSNKILVKPEIKRNKTEGGILIPETIKDGEPRYGEVFEVGDGNVMMGDNGSWAKIPLEVKVGDRVMFPPLDFVEVEYEGINYLLMTEEQILMKYSN